MHSINLPTDFNTNLLMLFRWLHLIAGVTWIGLLYFFNLVNVPFILHRRPQNAGTRARRLRCPRIVAGSCD